MKVDKEIIKAFCRFIDNYEGEMVVVGDTIYNDKKEVIYVL